MTAAVAAVWMLQAGYGGAEATPRVSWELRDPLDGPLRAPVEVLGAVGWALADRKSVV